MCGEVDGKPDAHDQVYHGNRVKIYVPQRHVSNDAYFDGKYAKCDPYRAQEVWNEDKRYEHHDDGPNHHTLNRSWTNQFKLIEKHKIRMKDGDIDR